MLRGYTHRVNIRKRHRLSIDPFSNVSTCLSCAKFTFHTSQAPKTSVALPLNLWRPSSSFQLVWPCSMATRGEQEKGDTPKRNTLTLNLISTPRTASQNRAPLLFLVLSLAFALCKVATFDATSGVQPFCCWPCSMPVLSAWRGNVMRTPWLFSLCVVIAPFFAVCGYSAFFCCVWL